VLGQVEYPHSTGIVYTATTQFLGFPHYGDEGKVMGLAPYGRPRFIDEFREIIRTEENGQFRLNLNYFRHHAEGVEMTWDEGSPVIGRVFSDEYAHLFGPPRVPGTPLSDRERDIAASLQLRLEEVGFHILNHLHDRTGLTDLGLAGGVAYNSVMNGKILLNTPFKRLFIQPAAGDSGTALGVCYQIYNGLLKRERAEVMTGAYTGPEFTNEDIRSALSKNKIIFEHYSDEELTKRAAQDIAAGLVVGWFQGRMEFGPRALGNRSIVVDPRRAEMKDVLNDRIKKREPFRPFAPSILEERVADYFEQTHPAPTMLMATGNSCRNARRRFRAFANSLARSERTLLSIDLRLRGDDRRTSGAQYVVQRERANRLHAAGSDRLFSEDADGRAVSRELRGQERVENADSSYRWRGIYRLTSL
jgi:carbamoyltransferase